MAGREPKIDGEKSRAGGRAINVQPIEPGAEMPKPPTVLGRWGRLAWGRAIRSLLPARVLSHGDLMALEMACRSYERWVIAEREIRELERGEAGAGEFATTPKGHRQMSALRVSASKAQKEFLQVATQFGLTPVSRVKTAGTAQGDFFAALEEPKAAAPAIDPTSPWHGEHLN